MQFKALIVAALASVSLAAPGAPPSCTPGTYQCYTDPKGTPGWQTCDVSGKWVFSGNCPPHTVCKFYKPSLSPYCVPPNFQFP